MVSPTEQIRSLIDQIATDDESRRIILRDIVAQEWPGMPPWSTLDAPVIEDVQKATVGCGIVLTFESDDGERYVVLGQAGDHYNQVQDSTEPLYTIPGGFQNLTDTIGSHFVSAAQGRPEHPREAAARETEEEFKNEAGSGLIPVDPDRLMAMDTLTLDIPSGEKRIVIGFMMELNSDEIATIQDHVKRLDDDANYKSNVVQHTLNPASGRPEMQSVAIVKLNDLVAGKHELLHKDQLSLFNRVKEFYDGYSPIGQQATQKPRPA